MAGAKPLLGRWSVFRTREFTKSERLDNQAHCLNELKKCSKGSKFESGPGKDEVIAMKQESL